MVQIYLLSVADLQQEKQLELAWEFLNQERKRKAARYKQLQDRMLSIGAGLLLQYALFREEPGTNWKEISLVSLLEVLSERKGTESWNELSFSYGSNGKPYVANGPYFSLSHSSKYVACAVSDREIGMDLQRKEPSNKHKMIHRYFQQEEKRVLEKARDEKEIQQLFYEIWTRKEAYGKLTGNGLKDGLEICVKPNPAQSGFWFQDFSGLEGYQGCICCYR